MRNPAGREGSEVLSAGRLLVTTQLHVMHVMSHATQKDFSLLPTRRMRLQDESLNDCKEEPPNIIFLKPADNEKSRWGWSQEWS